MSPPAGAIKCGSALRSITLHRTIAGLPAMMPSKALRVAIAAALAGLYWLIPAPILGQSEVVLGMSAAFSGASSQLGIELYRGSMAYFDHINSSGGLKGVTVRIKAYDDAYDPTKAILNTLKLIEQDHVFALFNYVGTPTVTRVLPVLTRFQSRQMFLLFPFTGAEPQRSRPYDKVAFNLRASYLDETAELVNYFMASNRTRIGIFYQVDAYGRSGWDGVRTALQNYGSKIAAETTYRRGTPYADSMSAQVAILRAAKVDAVISIGAYAAAAAFVRDAVDAGWDVPIANVSFVGSESMLQLLLDEGKKTGKDYTHRLINSQVVPSYDDVTLPAVREYRELTTRYAPPPPPGIAGNGQPPAFSFVGFEGFLNAKLMVEILSRMGSVPDALQLRDTVESIQKFDLGIAAPVTFGPDRNQGLHTVYYTRVENGRFVPLRPGERAP
jgi:ABC-type branched-subunit amino acid transport system substrate-binding protein